MTAMETMPLIGNKQTIKGTKMFSASVVNNSDGQKCQKYSKVFLQGLFTRRLHTLYNLYFCITLYKDSSQFF